MAQWLLKCKVKPISHRDYDIIHFDQARVWLKSTHGDNGIFKGKAFFLLIIMELEYEPYDLSKEFAP